MFTHTNTAQHNKTAQTGKSSLCHRFAIVAQPVFRLAERYEVTDIE